MSEKTVTATVSISTDGRVEGRYFIDVRDTTGGANWQMTTRITDTPADFIRDLTTEAIRQGIIVEYIDTTGE